MTKLITFLTVLLISNITFTDDCFCEQAIQPESMNKNEILIAQDIKDAERKTIGEYDAFNHALRLDSICSVSINASGKRIAKSFRRARLSVYDIDDLFSFTCDNGRVFTEHMVFNANNTGLNAFINNYEKRIAKGKLRPTFIKEFLNYQIPNRNNDGGYHTLLEYLSYTDTLMPDDQELLDHTDKFRQLIISKGAIINPTNKNIDSSYRYAK